MCSPWKVAEFPSGNNTRNVVRRPCYTCVRFRSRRARVSRHTRRFLLGYRDTSLLVGISGEGRAVSGRNDLKRDPLSVLYRTPEQGYWITVIFNYEHEDPRETRAKCGSKPEIGRRE